MRWARENDFDGMIGLASGRTGVVAELIKAVIAVESRFDPAAINYGDPGWAWGLMQMIPTTARGLGYTGPMQGLIDNPALAIDLGADLLAQNLSRTGGTVADSVSAYNGGFRPSLGYGSPRPDGSYANQDYVNRVLDAFQYFVALGAPSEPWTPSGEPPPGGGEPPGAAGFRGSGAVAGRDRGGVGPTPKHPASPGFFRRLIRWLGGRIW